nr:integrase, catalytic region, zinc finger, CCHC-type, peptidase aspartic, catalytic [Tanacetum cinerariifolium]
MLVTLDPSLTLSQNKSEQIDQNDEDIDLAKEHFKNKNKSLIEVNNKLSVENDQLYADYTKSKAKLQRRNSVEYASEIELECAKAKGDLLSYKMEYQRSYNKYTPTINDLNQTVSELKHKLSAQQDTIFILKQQKDAQIKLYKNREDKDIEKVIDLENKSRPQLKSNPQGDRVLRNNSRGTKLEVEEHLASESIKKPRNNVRKLHEHFRKIYKWSYIKFTLSGYIWKPKSKQENVNLNVSMPLGNASRTANVKDTMTSRSCNDLFSVGQFCDVEGLNHNLLWRSWIWRSGSRVYYVEGLNHNLFSVGQFCDADLEVAFRKSTCFIRDLKGNDILT